MGGIKIEFAEEKMMRKRTKLWKTLGICCELSDESGPPRR